MPAKNMPRARKDKRMNSDPVLPDQSGRLMQVDPLGTNGPPEELVRRRAYEIYEHRGREEGRAWQHWFQAEDELQVDLEEQLQAGNE